MYLQPLIPPKRFDVLPPDWGIMLRRSRRVQIVLLIRNSNSNRNNSIYNRNSNDICKATSYAHLQGGPPHKPTFAVVKLEPTEVESPWFKAQRADAEAQAERNRALEAAAAADPAREGMTLVENEVGKIYGREFCCARRADEQIDT